MKFLTFLTVIIISVVSANAQEDQQLISLGNKLYKQQQFEKAAAEYQKAAELNNKNAKAQYNMGNALYRSNKIEQAEKAFDAAAGNAEKEEVKSSAFYNKGVSLSQQKKLLESIDAYKETLRLIPDDNDARENLQKALNELKKQQDQKQSPKNDEKKKNDQDKQNDKKQDKAPQNKSKLNQKQAEQMLNALRQEEKDIQKDLQKNKIKNGNIPEKDW